MRRPSGSTTQRHRTIPNVLNAVSMIGLPFLAWGLFRYQLWPTLLGMVLITGTKLWYIDRMAVLYDDMVAAQPHLGYRRTHSVRDEPHPRPAPGDLEGLPTDPSARP